ncbi:hypothetical protein ABVF61_20700 [Roseibium sp. HPY-6]|uniref:hypothetical protein n=1 Tax=Roseibium sp. HPY-6 TaxID=3229852 RepID=UPI00338F6C29
MKRSSWPLAGPLVLALAVVSGLAIALEDGPPVASGCENSLSPSSEFLVQGTKPGTQLAGMLPGAAASGPAPRGASTKKSYFSVEPRHRPSWWRSAGAARRATSADIHVLRSDEGEARCPVCP